MNNVEHNRKIIKALHKLDFSEYKNLRNLLDMCLAIKSDDLELAICEAKIVRQYASVGSRKDVKFVKLYYDALLFLAPYDFDSYLIYMEKDRDAKSRFYLPRRKQFHKIGIIEDLQALENGEIDLLAISMPPGVGKTTLGELFISWVIGRHPEDYNLFASHSGDITRMCYDAVNNITSGSEYLWSDVFPTVKKESENAKTEMLNFGHYKPFKSLQCTSVGSKNAGKVRCNRYLYCDDLIGGIEEALSKPRLDKLWTTYSVDLRQRKKDGCKELHIATRWSVHDVIGRLQARYGDNGRSKFVAIPDIDSATGRSNFNFDYGVGFTTEYFNDMEETMDDVSYRCLFKNEPIEREGILYHNDELRRYLKLPEGKPDAVLGICDTKDKGLDFMFMPCVAVYGNDHYCIDCICDDNSDYGIQYEMLCNLIIENKMQKCQFESNNGGSRVAYDVDNLVESKGWSCNITSEVTSSNKETKIIVNADWVKKHVLFKDESMYKKKSHYGRMMAFLLSYSVAGKNDHDDVPDGWAQYALMVQDALFRKVEVFSRASLGI